MNKIIFLSSGTVCNKNAYKKYVVPDMTAQGINRLIELQLQQSETLSAIAESMGERMYDNLTGMMNLQIGQLDKTLSAFCNSTTKNQMDKKKCPEPETRKYFNKRRKSIKNQVTS